MSIWFVRFAIGWLASCSGSSTLGRLLKIENNLSHRKIKI